MSDILENQQAFNCTFSQQQEEYKKKLSFLSFGILKFQNFYSITKSSTKILIVLALSILMGFVNFFLIERTGIYTPGINAIHQAVAKLFFVLFNGSLSTENAKLIYSIIFWGLNVVVNFVFYFCCHKKLGKSFSYLTLLYLTVLAATGLLLSNAPESWGLKYFYVFSNPNSNASQLTSAGIKMVTWPHETSNVVTTAAQTATTTVVSKEPVLIALLYGFVYAIINAFVSLIIYALGSGMGGLDWVIFYLYKTKSYSSSTLLFYCGLAISFSAYMIGTFIPYVYKLGKDQSFNVVFPNVLSPTFLATLVMIFTKKTLFAVFYPQFKFLYVKVFTNKSLEIRNLLIEKNFRHSFTIVNTVGGYGLKKQTQLEFICFFLELHELIKNIRTVDPKGLIIATPIKSLNGHMNIHHTTN